MVRRQKLISMTDDHFEFASQLPNFSKWVRNKIDEYIQNENKQPKAIEYMCSGCKTRRTYGSMYSRLKGNHFPITRACPTMDCFTEMYRHDFYRKIHGEDFDEGEEE